MKRHWADLYTMHCSLNITCFDSFLGPNIPVMRGTVTITNFQRSDIKQQGHKADDGRGKVWTQAVWLLSSLQHRYPVQCLWWSNRNPILFLSFLMSFCFWEKKTQRGSRGGTEREGDTESKAGSRLRAVITEPDVGLELTNCETRTWTEVRRSTDWATQVPHPSIYF